MNHKPIAVFVPAPLRHDEWKRKFTLNWIDSEPAVITHLYSEDLVRQQQAEIERLSNDNYKFIKAMANKDSHIESLKQLLNDSALRKAQEK